MNRPRSHVYQKYYRSCSGESIYETHARIRRLQLLKQSNKVHIADEQIVETIAHELQPPRMGRWKAEEDRLLRAALEHCGHGNWTHIAEYMHNAHDEKFDSVNGQHRTAKQVRQHILVR